MQSAHNGLQAPRAGLHLPSLSSPPSLVSFQPCCFLRLFSQLVPCACLRAFALAPPSAQSVLPLAIHLAPFLVSST